MGQWKTLPFSTIFGFLLGERVLLLCDWKCIKWIWRCRFKCLEWRLLCKAFLSLVFFFLFIVVLKYDGSYSAGPGCNEFSCISGKIRDSLYKEYVGNFSFLGSCTEKHGECQIIALSSLVLTQGIVLLLVGSFAIDLIASRTAFLCHSFCCVYFLLPFHCCLSLWAQPVLLYHLVQVG